MLEALGVGGTQNTNPGEVAIDSTDETWTDIDGMLELIFRVSVVYLINCSPHRQFVRSKGVTRICSLCRSTSGWWSSR